VSDQELPIWSVLLRPYNHIEERRRKRMHFAGAKSGIPKHLLELSERVRIAFPRPGEHHQAEAGR
jgi:hypothetical protein